MRTPPFSAATARLLGKALRSGDAVLQQLAARHLFRLLRIPPEATRALPGTEAKLFVMAERVADGYSAFHPLDRRLDQLPEDVGAVIQWRYRLDAPRVLGVVQLKGSAAPS